MPKFSFSRGLSRVPAAVLNELGIITLWQSSTDAKLLCAQRFVRMLAYGSVTVVLASYFSTLGFSDSRIGMFMTLTLLGDGIVSFFLTFFADAIGRRVVLALGSSLMVASGLVFALSSDYVVLLLAAILGVISPTGNETGPFRAVEESTLADVTPPELLGDMIVWYSLLGNMGAAFGMVTCGWTVDLLQSVNGWSFVEACRTMFFAFAAIGGLKLALSLCLSGNAEAIKENAPRVEQQQRQNATESQPLLADENRDDSADTLPRRKNIFSSWDRELTLSFIKISVLYGLESFASGCASPPWVAYFFKQKFNMPERQLGTIFSTTTIIAAVSMLVATSMAKRIGNVNTMVSTHMISSLWLILLPIPSSLPLALTFLTLCSCSQNMDVAPCGTFIATILPANKRTSIMGALNIIKTYSQCFGPFTIGVLATRGMLGWSFTMAGVLKVIYDIGMFVSFSGIEN